MKKRSHNERVANELLMLLRLRKKTAREVSLYEPIGTDKEGNEISLLDIIEGANTDLAEKMDLATDTKKLYRRFGEVLGERECEVLSLRYGLFGEEETTQKKIAEKLGISRSYVSRIEKNAIEKLRNSW